MKIVTRLDPKPIPVRNFDWSAVTDNYEPGADIGFGSTEQEAIADLTEKLNERVELHKRLNERTYGKDQSN